MNRMAPTRALAAALVAAFLAMSTAGCSAGGADDAGQDATDEVLTLQEARETYRDLSDDFDSALDPFYDEYDRTTPSVPALQEAAADASRASAGFAADLAATAWPEEVDPGAVSAVAEDYQVYATQWDDVTAATDLGDVADLLCEMDEDLAAAAENVNRLRTDLGLEPVDWGVGDDSCAGGAVFGDDQVTP